MHDDFAFIGVRCVFDSIDNFGFEVLAIFDQLFHTLVAGLRFFVQTFSVP